MRQRLTVGRGGWACWVADEFPAPVYVRFGETDGVLVVVDLYLGHDGGISATDLRAIPLGQIEAWVRSDPTLSSAVRAGIGHLGLDFRSAAPYFATAFGPKAGDHWVRRMMQGIGDPVPPMKAPELPRKYRPPGLQVVPPGGRGFYGAGFYKNVAEAYRAALADGLRPAPAIAEASEVPVTTVHRWVKEARRLGFLPPGRAGKAG